MSPGKNDALDRELAAVRAARDDPSAPESQTILRKALSGKRNFAVAAAAEIVGEAGLRELAPLLPEAFDRFVEKGAKTDGTCRAKTAIATALQRLEWDDADFFLRGIVVVQREAVWGGNVDTAAELRGACALGLAVLHDPRAVGAIAGLLADPEWMARLHAARALGATGKSEAETLLRYKAAAGDPEPQVQTEVFLSLLELAPRDSLAFVAGFLAPEPPAAGHLHNVVAGAPARGSHCTTCGKPSEIDGDAVADAAALALGQSRREDALAILKQWNETLLPSRRRVPLLAIAMQRGAPAIDYLLALVAGESIAVAVHAVAALALHRHDEALADRVRAAVATRGDEELERALHNSFRLPL